MNAGSRTGKTALDSDLTKFKSFESYYDSKAAEKYALCVSKSVYTQEYQVFLEQLRVAREAAGLTQRDVARLMERSQSFVAKCEQGHNRVDVAQLVEFCRAIGIPLVDFMIRYQAALDQPEPLD